jgi:CelD/BcsL family acetyltransferase involved in cellulose biosynthesis
MAPASLQVFEGPRVFAEHGARWQELLDRTQSPVFFLRPDWLQLWADQFGAGRRCFLAVAERGGEWIGGLPLILGEGRIGQRWEVPKLEAAGTPYFDRMEVPAADDADCRETLRLILDWARATGGWSAFAFHEVPAGSPTHRALESLAAERGFDLHAQLASRAPIVDLETGGKTSSKYRRQLRQSMEQLEEEGRVECAFEFVDADRIGPLIAECKQVECSSWKGDQGVGVFRRGPVGDFMRGLWRELVPRQELALATIRLDGRLIIYHWGFLHRGRFLSYNLAQVPETNRVRGGSLLLKHMVDTGRDLGIEVIDASRGSLESPNIIGRYKGPVRAHGDFILDARSAHGRFLEGVRHRAIPAARRLLRQGGPPALDPDEAFVD